MLPGQMLSGQMLLRQLKSIQYSPMNLRLKFRQNRVSNSWDITDIEFLWGGGLGWGVQSHFHAKPNFGWIVVELTLSLVWVVGGGGVKSFSCKTQT